MNRIKALHVAEKSVLASLEFRVTADLPTPRLRDLSEFYDQGITIIS